MDIMPTASELCDEAIRLQEAGKLDEAVAKLEALVADQPDYALAHSALSVYYGKLDRHEEAVQQALIVCQLEPTDPFSFMSMSLICQRAGRIAEAEQAMAQSMELQWAAKGG
jgi:Flp pilus assembly protein TadD